MIYVGLDDTDTLDTPGTNQLARHLVHELAFQLTGRMILRHQLLEDPRVPCTRKNGCASIQFELIHPLPPGEGWGEGALFSIAELAARLHAMIVAWCPPGSDPGLCVTESVPPPVTAWGKRCKRQLVTQDEARDLAAAHQIHLEGLAGTQDGVIGALAAVGLMATRNDGRVIYLASVGGDGLDISGKLPVDAILARGIDDIRDVQSNLPVTTGTVAVEKKLRPNYRHGRIVLYASRRGDSEWDAVRVT